MVTKRCRQRNLHEMSYTIKYRVKTRLATGVAVSAERVKYRSKTFEKFNQTINFVRNGQCLKYLMPDISKGSLRKKIRC